nr:Morn repeat domain containing protein [Pandoravirus belohorizontensis]
MEPCDDNHNNGGDGLPERGTTTDIVFRFDLLPDELVMTMLKWAPDGATVEAWSLTSRRHHTLGTDPTLWRHLCERHFGPPLHNEFQRWGKDWRWVYRARSRDGRTGRTRVGEVNVLLNGKRGTYYGDLVNGRPHGYGAMLIPPLKESSRGGRHDQSVEPPAQPKLDCYEGEWNNGAISGYGICRWSCGMRYEGEYKDNARDGYGVVTWPSGARYEGERKNGHRHGTGTHVWTSGNQYSGEWADNEMHGHGIYRWADGTRYDGQHASDRLAGRGVVTYLDGSVYDGEWLRGRKHGDGVHTYSDGSITWEHWARGVPKLVVVLVHRAGNLRCDGAADTESSLCEACVATRPGP